ncbi:MAG: ATP synthase F0 subunit A [Candidatus Harrisonbacteria bacterium CG10_big_fil_rev_8_21_14_0_10_42_17]|uniref:ATP synthase subunit a n=1 Tax=Candidatus Harrisonbacteria bacterium CG10_big_fil_rev_8_21_14_0_10_42_17 TaxID=1974584 RepID=A0A2M6WGU8_9BACT|nr:MAG: ATP synthase F0 subunit A [Candidatus Harrisonbacteria bacterium CG10_big_fil_rev_8_21_14_0_10_42_17]
MEKHLAVTGEVGHEEEPRGKTLHEEVHEESSSPMISLKAEPLFSIGSFSVTNSIVLAFVTLLVLCSIGLAFKKKVSLIPKLFQSLVEVAVEGFLKIMDSVLGDRNKSEKYLPLVATIFFFIMVSNWLGLLPGVGSIGVNIIHEGHETFTPVFRAPAADLNFTIAIAILAVFGVNLSGVFAIGFFKHFKKFFTLKNPIYTFVGILEFFSEFAKIVSFSFRLFGNIFAGEVLLIIVGFLVPYVVPLPFLMLEIFVGFIQAFIFAMLTLVFIAGAIVEEAH